MIGFRVIGFQVYYMYATHGTSITVGSGVTSKVVCVKLLMTELSETSNRSHGEQRGCGCPADRWNNVLVYQITDLF